MDIAAWLRELGLERYEPAFRENEIDAEVLPELTESDLSALGLPIGPRRMPGPVRGCRRLQRVQDASGQSLPTSRGDDRPRRRQGPLDRRRSGAEAVRD